jgi:hypothetical protein
VRPAASRALACEDVRVLKAAVRSPEKRLRFAAYVGFRKSPRGETRGPAAV